MRGMILAAGLGQRMGALTQDTPKPLLRVGGHYLIEYALANFKRAGICEIVINLAYRGEQIKAALGDGERYGVAIAYSQETERLEVGGGIAHALPLLGDKPFVVASGDVITDYAFSRLPKEPRGLAHLVMVDNPPFHAQGDFGLRDGYVDLHVLPKFNFGGISLYQPAFFAQVQPGFVAWNKVILPAIERGDVTGEYYKGLWFNIGTAQDLVDVNQRALEDATLRPLALN